MSLPWKEACVVPTRGCCSPYKTTKKSISLCFEIWA